MRAWIAGVWLVGSASAGLAAGCASQSNTAYFLDAGSDASASGGDAGGDGTTSCGASGEACCAGQVCDNGLACSSGSCVEASEGGGDDASGGQDSGTGKDAAGGKDAGDGDGGSDKDASTKKDGEVDDGGVADCGSAPKIFPDEAGAIYCGYDKGYVYCEPGNQCCVGGALGGGNYAPEQCAAFGKACTNGGAEDAGGSPGLPVECGQISDCTANGVKAVACCLRGANPPSDDGCTYPRVVDGTGIACETGSGKAPAKCKTGETNVCSTQADCPAGTTCTAGKWKVFDLGFCL